jgi:diaminohydroxyphosphoribosylaminopyrimidine deaminase/5-amino-6-(5-phosphoribosylamino)uracil reductase
VVGAGTVLADDPQLTVRAEDGTPSARQPLRVVLDRSGRTPAHARVRDGSATTLVLTDAEPVGALGHLYERGVRHVLLEGGPTLAGAFVAAGCVDRVVCYLAPLLLGAGPAALGEAGIGTLADALALRIDEVRMVGADVRITARPVRTGASDGEA